MPIEAIVKEAEQLHRVGTRLELLADEHPPMAEGLIGVAGSVRSAATILELLVATKPDDGGPPKIQ